MLQKGGLPIVLGMADNETEDSTSMVHGKMDAKSRKMCVKKCKKRGRKCTNKCLKKMMSKKNKRGGGIFEDGLNKLQFLKNGETSNQINPEIPMQMQTNEQLRNNDDKSTFLGKYDPRNLFNNTIGGKRLKRKSKKTRRKNKKNKSRRKH